MKFKSNRQRRAVMAKINQRPIRLHKPIQYHGRTFTDPEHERKWLAYLHMHGGGFITEEEREKHLKRFHRTHKIKTMAEDADKDLFDWDSEDQSLSKREQKEEHRRSFNENMMF